jgi:hypothetical protein
LIAFEERTVYRSRSDTPSRLLGKHSMQLMNIP